MPAKNPVAGLLAGCALNLAGTDTKCSNFCQVFAARRRLDLRRQRAGQNSMHTDATSVNRLTILLVFQRLLLCGWPAVQRCGVNVIRPTRGFVAGNPRIFASLPVKVFYVQAQPLHFNYAVESSRLQGMPRCGLVSSSPAREPELLLIIDAGSHIFESSRLDNVILLHFCACDFGSFNFRPCHPRQHQPVPVQQGFLLVVRKFFDLDRTQPRQPASNLIDLNLKINVVAGLLAWLGRRWD